MTEVRTEERTAFEDAVRGWWGDLQGDPGQRALLRRCATTAQVAFAPAFHRLLRATGNATSLERLAAIAAVLSHVRQDAPGKGFAEQLAAPKNGKATLSGLRFRRLLALDGADELLVGLVRAVRLLDGRANVADLAKSIRFWGDARRKDWACKYYDVADKEP